MLYRKITSYIEDYLKSDTDKILILEGVRQIGKSFSTREAYAGLHIQGGIRPDLRQAVCQPVAVWRNLIVNDFETSVFPAHPAIAALKDDMYRRGALYASMTGSGAAVFGLFPA